MLPPKSPAPYPSPKLKPGVITIRMDDSAGPSEKTIEVKDWGVSGGFLVTSGIEGDIRGFSLDKIIYYHYKPKESE